jgi:peptide/nickel transport system substrate-binding protein
MIFGLIIAGCSNEVDGGNSDPGTSNENGPSQGIDQENKTLTIASPTGMATMDLHDHDDHVTLHAVNNMYNSLFYKANDGELVPDLVDSYENVDETTWKFTLHEGVTFHNGDELTAEDVKFTLERVAYDESLILHGIFNVIKEVSVTSDYEFEIVTHEPDPLLIGVLARPAAGIYPKKYIEENGFEHFLSAPVGTGPYQFVELNQGNNIVFKRYENYFKGVTAEWESLTFRSIPEASTRVGELLTGGVDLIPNVVSNEWERIENHENTYLASSNSQRVALIVPNATEGRPTSDPKVRKAIELAIDNQAIIDALLGGDGTPTSTRVTPGNFGANEELFDTFNYDIEQAKKLLEEAGYGDGVKLTMHAPNGRYTRDAEVAQMVTGMLSEVGITVDLQLMEWNSYLELRRAQNVGDLHMLWFANSYYDGHILYSDQLHSDRGLTEMGYDNPELVEVLTGSTTNMDVEERKQQLQRAQEIEVEDVLRIYLYLEHNNYGVNNSIEFNPRIDELIIAEEIRSKQ